MVAVRSEVVNMENRRNFNTLRYANRLKAVGVPEKQAEVQAELQSETISDLLEGNFANKQDINELKRDIKELDTKLTGNIKELESKIERNTKELDLKIETVKVEIKLSEECTNKNITLMGHKIFIGLGGMITAGVAIIGFLIKLP